MKKIPTIFKRDFTKPNAPITQEWNLECEWVRDGFGWPTRKFDGTSCMWDGHKLWKRRELRADDAMPAGFILVGADIDTNKRIGWVPIVAGSPDDKWHWEAVERDIETLKANVINSTYELVGPKVNGNRDKYPHHTLIRHGSEKIEPITRNYEAIRAWLETHEVEGIVWHGTDPEKGMAKIKRRDFGFRW